MANSSLKTIINARNTSFKITGNRTVSALFSSSNLNDDYFSLYVSGGSYQFYNAKYTDYYEEQGYVKTKDDVGWPHSIPYVPGAVIQMQVYAPSTKTYSVNVKLNGAFGYSDNSSTQANSFYRFRMDIDGNEIHDDGWKDGYEWPYNQNMKTNIVVPDDLSWIDFGSYNVELTKGIHIVLMRFGACHQNNQHAAIYINNMRVSLT